MEVQAKEMLDAILRRRTTSTFTNKPVSDETIAQLMQMAMFAPTRLGRRPWQFVVLQDAQIRQKLGSALKLGPDTMAAPVLVAMCGDKRLSDAWDLDAVAAAQNLMVAATTIGLGTAWVAGPVNPLWEHFGELFAKTLNVPAGIGLVALLAIGYPADAKPSHTEADVYEQSHVHFERWGNTRG
jgi:nitroreductase